jgi:hypothetical protein
MEGEGQQSEPTRQGWTFFRIRRIHSDLMKLQQGLNDNIYSTPRKLMRYFMRAYEQGSQWPAKIRLITMYRQFCRNYTWFAFMNFYLEGYHRNDNKVKFYG